MVDRMLIALALDRRFVHREQFRGGRSVAAGQGPAELEGIRGLLRAQHQTALVRAARDRDRGTGDARDHGVAEASAGRQTAQGVEHCRLYAHQRPDGRPHRNADQPGRQRQMGRVQYLLDAGRSSLSHDSTLFRSCRAQRGKCKVLFSKWCVEELRAIKIVCFVLLLLLLPIFLSLE